MGPVVIIALCGLAVLCSIPLAMWLFRKLHGAPVPAGAQPEVVKTEAAPDAQVPTETLSAVTEDVPAEGEPPSPVAPETPTPGTAPIGDELSARFGVDLLGPYVRPAELAPAVLVPGEVPGWSTGAWRTVPAPVSEVAS